MRPIHSTEIELSLPHRVGTAERLFDAAGQRWLNFAKRAKGPVRMDRSSISLGRQSTRHMNQESKRTKKIADVAKPSRRMREGNQDDDNPS